MRYKEKGFHEFLGEIVEEILEKEFPKGGIPEGMIEEKRKNEQKVLKHYLEALEMNDILENEKYRKGKKRVYPIHFQILCKALLFQKRASKKDFGYKIIHKKFDEIEECEIKEFSAIMCQEFDNWFENLEYNKEKKKKSKKSKEELDEDYCAIEEAMFEEQSTERIDTLSVKDGYTKEEVNYLKKKFRIKMEKNVFISELENKLYYQLQKDKIVKEIQNRVGKKLQEFLELEAITDKMTILNEFKDKVLGEIPLPVEYTKKFSLTDKDKCDILLDFMSNCMCYMESYNIEVIKPYKGTKKDKGFIDFRSFMIEKMIEEYEKEYEKAEELEKEDYEPEQALIRYKKRKRNK